ncbi:MAG: hypothetical protein RLZZ230_693 [Candidatus Parcubacteria bacterium]|jgi:hypothetical protein
MTKKIKFITVFVILAAFVGGAVYYFFGQKSVVRAYSFPVDSSISSLSISLQPLGESVKTAVGFTPDPTYELIAQETGGQVISMTPEEFSNNPEALSEVLMNKASSDVSTILYGESYGGNKSLIEAMIIMPSGTELLNEIPTPFAGIKVIHTGGGITYKIENPETGEWKINIPSDASYSLQVDGVTDIDLYRFEKVKLAGRLGHEGYFSTDEPFKIGEEATIETVVFGLTSKDSVPKFYLVAKNNDTLAEIPDIKSELDDTFYGTVSIPSQQFRIVVKGVNDTGQEYQRMSAQIYAPE